MKRRFIFGSVLALLAIHLAVGAYTFHASAAADKESAYPSLEVFTYVMEKVRREYVDGSSLTYKELVHNAVKGMIQELDPHSEFMEPSSFKDLKDETQGAFGGLGIVIGVRDNWITVITPMEDSPGSRAGILSGDRIIKIDGKSTEKMNSTDAVKLLRGEPNTEVTVTILRPSNNLQKDLKMKRSIITVDMAKDIHGKREFPLGEDKIGYVRLVQFGEKTGSELEDAMKKLKAQGMKAFVLDLRWNPGGLLDQAVEVCEKFLPRGSLVVTTEGRVASNIKALKAEGKGDQLVDARGNPMPMVILINLGSASASEIVAGCLQDHKRAVLVGETSFGKGSVQSVLPLQDGSALRLTTAKYYTPSHKVIHENGVTPDVLVTMTDEQERDIVLQRSPGGVESVEGKDRERIRNANDPQLDRATDLLKGIMLFTQRSPDTREGDKSKMASAK